MKRKRGRPPGKKFALPHTTAEGFDIATYGKNLVTMVTPSKASSPPTMFGT
jgi:hypothetical protein